MVDQDTVREGISLTRLLNVEGWGRLDAVLLAALATESPLLLIGPHGTAKTLLVERLSDALHLAYRHYNASLLNYDDLVGIPMPDETGESLRFITTPGAIWDAEFVFFDEISRCRPDLQNKLFPIIHERRVVGIGLQHLRYRWAAMNPPSPDDADMSAGAEIYLGSEPLDPALTDRFPFVVPVPTWQQLSPEDRRRIVTLRPDGLLVSPEEASRVIPELVEACAVSIGEVEENYGDWIADYVVCVMDLLNKAGLAQSPRRARMLAGNIASVHAARQVLNQESDMEESALLALLYGIPHTATEVPPPPGKLIAIHRQAWEIVDKLEDDRWRRLLQEADLIQRVVIADELDFDDEDLSQIITQALNEDRSEAHRMGLATAIFLAFQSHRVLTPAAWEPLVALASRVLQPRVETISLTGNAQDRSLWNEIKTWVLKRREQDGLGVLETNYVLAGYPQLWRTESWKEARERFLADLKRFGIKEM